MYCRSNIASLLAVAALLAACSGDDARQNDKTDRFTVTRGDLPITVRENAELQALRETIVRSEVEGQSTIIYIVPEGTQVKQGDRLFELAVNELVEKRASQAISVAKADAALVQARKEKEILEKELSTKLNTAASNLRIAEMDLEKLLGRRASAVSEARNADVVKRIESLVAPAPLAGGPASTVANGTDAAPQGPAASPRPEDDVVAAVDPRAYAGLVDKAYELLSDGATGDSARRAVNEREMGDMANKILQQVDTIRLAMADLKVKEDTFLYSRNLAEKQFITRNELEKDRLAYQSQVSKVSLAWNDLDLLVNYVLASERIKLTQNRDNASLELERVKGSNEAAVIKSDSDLQSKVAEYELAKERLDSLDRQIKSAVVLAPTPGTVVYARLDRNRGGGEAVKEGVQVRERQEIIILPDTTRMRCVIKVQEAQVLKVKVGQPTAISVDAFPGETFTGTVTSVAPVPDSNSGWSNADRKVYTTVVELDSPNADGRLRSRNTASVTIMVDVVKDTLPVPIQAVERDRAVKYVWRATAAGPEAVVVKTGQHNSEYVELLAGVEENDVIYLRPPQGVQPPNFPQPQQPAADPAPAKTPEGGAVAANPGAGPGQAPGPTANAAPTGEGNRRGPGGGPGGGMGKKLVDMSSEELDQYKDRVSSMTSMVDRVRSSQGEEAAAKLTSTISELRKALDAGDLATAQTYRDALSGMMRGAGGGRRNNGGGGGGGDNDGPRGPRRDNGGDGAAERGN